MQNKLKKFLFIAAALVFWLAVWEFFARVVNLNFILPTVEQTLSALASLVVTAVFWKTVLLSFVRIILGLLLGVLLGIILAAATNYIPIINTLISPLITVIRATPVASFIMVLWFIIGSDAVPTVIALLMVMPVIWQNLTEGFANVDGDLKEVCDIYEIHGLRRLRILVVPTLVKYLIPGIITAAGLAWKSGIAAEIIAYTSDSIGKEIYIAKAFLESAEMFAWTMVVVILSLTLELILSRLGRRLAVK